MKRVSIGCTAAFLSLAVCGPGWSQPVASQMSPAQPANEAVAASASSSATSPILSVPTGAGPMKPAQGTLAELATQLAKSPDTVVADVNGTPITLGMVSDRLRDMPDKLEVLPSSVLYRGALNDLETQRALAIKAKALGLDKNPETIRRIAEATDHELGRALVRRVVPEMVNDAAVEKLYKSTIAGKPGPAEVSFRVIGVPTEDEADTLLQRLRGGASFNDLARQFSKDPSSLAGGEIGYQRRDMLQPEIGAVVFALAPGQMTSYPIYASGLWFIIEVRGRQQGPTPTLAEARPQLLGQLDGSASLEIFSKTKASVTIKDFGPTGSGSRDSDDVGKMR